MVTRGRSGTLEKKPMATRRAPAPRESRSFTVVVGVDTTSASDVALAEAIAAAATKPRASVHVVYGLDIKSGGGDAKSIRKVEAALDKGGARLKTYLDREGANAGLGGRPLVAQVRLAAPAKAIVQVAVDVDADLIVVGTSGHRGISNLLQSSTSAKVLRAAPCAVLVARPKSSGGRAKSPGIQPACPQCRALQTMTAGTQWWCARHAEHAGTSTHIYHYQRELNLRSPPPPGGT